MNTNEKKIGERIPLQGTINTRDLGGYTTEDGRKVRFKRVIRTDNLSRLTDEDITFLVGQFNPKYDIDLRSSSECLNKQDKPIPGCELIYLPVSEDLDNNGIEHPHEEFITDSHDLDGLIHFIYILSKDGDVTKAMENSYINFISTDCGKRNYRRFFEILKDNREGSVLFHCADGKDRAGLAAAMFLLILGVDEETVKKEYLLTNDNTWDKAISRYNYLKNDCGIQNEKLLNSVKMLAGVRINWLNAALDKINLGFGGIENYFTEQLGFSKEDIKSLRDNYLESF